MNMIFSTGLSQKPLGFSLLLVIAKLDIFTYAVSTLTFVAVTAIGHTAKSAVCGTPAEAFGF
jgi:hypothetical protein